MSTENSTPTTTNPEAGSAPAPAPAPRTKTVRRTFQDYDEKRGAYWTEETEEIPVEEPKAAEPEQEQEQQQEDDGPEERTVQADVQLVVPEFVEGAQADDVQGYLDAGLADVVKGAGMSGDEVNAIVRLAVDNELAATQKFVPGDRDANLGVIRNAWGSMFEANLGAVQNFVARTPGLGKYLDETGLGDVPSVIFAIHAHVSGVTKLSKAEAKRQLDEALKPGSKYLAGDRAEVRRVRALTNVAHDGVPEAPKPVAPKPSQASGLQAERTRLMQSPAFLDKRHADHAKTMAAYKAVTEKLYPERG